jgi:hypothetical protein
MSCLTKTQLLYIGERDCFQIASSLALSDDLVEETRERNMDIVQWCAQHGTGACGTPPSN